MALTTTEHLATFFGIFMLYWGGLVVYRLYLSPLAKFPGPKLASATLWYEFYYDVVKRGRYTWKIEELHKQYGPIVRINPHELHINDPDYYDELYSTTRRTNKYPWAMKAFGPTLSGFQTELHETHRARRSALAPFFSKKSVTQVEPLIHSATDKLVSRFQEARDTGAVVNLFHAFVALTNDIICEYAFASPQNFVELPEYGASWAEALFDTLETSLLFKQFPVLEPIMRSIPASIAKMMNPRLAALSSIMQVCQSKVANVRAGIAEGKDLGGQRTIFYDMATSKELSDLDKSDARLESEGVVVMVAGSNTTGHTLSIIAYHLIKHEDVLEKMQTELQAAQEKSHAPLKWAELEQLPYLTAVITEGLRWSCGVTAHLQRISPDMALQFGEWSIPAGTPVSMSAPLIHYNADIFPEPQAFKPERWLQPGSGRLRKYLVAFSKGSRQCLGMNLAYAELFITTATVFGSNKVKLELYETDDSDVEIRHDFFAPFARLNSKGIRVMVK